MLKRITITFLFMMVFAILAVFSATQVLPEESIIVQPAQIDFEEFVAYTDTAGISRIARIKRTGRQTTDLQVWINGELQPPEAYKSYDDLRFCHKATATDKGAIQFDKDLFFVCSELREVRDKSFLLGNHVKCPYFLDPPGKWIELCIH